jgi:hypothetical protein
MFGFEYDEKAACTGICPGIGQLEGRNHLLLPRFSCVLRRCRLGTLHATPAHGPPPDDNSNAAWFLSCAEHILNLLFERCCVCNRNVWRLNAR